MIRQDIEKIINNTKIVPSQLNSSLIKGYQCATYVPLHADQHMFTTSFDDHWVTDELPYFVFDCIWSNDNCSLLQMFNGFWIATPLVNSNTYVLNAWDEHALVPNDVAESFIRHAVRPLPSGREL